MNFSQRMIKTATKLINKYGSTLTLKKPSSSSYNPTTGKVETVAGQEFNFKAHFSQYESEEVQGLIETGDIKVITFYDENITYTDKDTIVIDGINYNIKNVMPTKAQDQNIIYEIQLRK